MPYDHYAATKMKTSSLSKLREFYEDTADSYAEMMDAEIDLPVYSDILGRLAERTSGMPGPIIDTSCGPGHVLARYRARYDPKRSLVGIDLSPRMVDLASAMLGASAEVLTGDMRHLEGIESNSAAAVISFFAIHHVDSDDAVIAFQEWSRVLRPGGQLVVAAWEGSGQIDYGDASDVVALRYTREELTNWAHRAGLAVDRCTVEPVDGMPMKAVYLEGTPMEP